MSANLRSFFTYANVVSTMCLFIVLGGGAYAATTLPKNSVGAKTIKANAVRSAEIRKGSVTSSDVKNASLLAADFKAGQIPAGPTGPKGDRGANGATRLVTRNGNVGICSGGGCFVTAEVSCATGERAVGGGGYRNSDDALTDSGPIGGTPVPGDPLATVNPTGWSVTAKDPTGGDGGGSVGARVVCAAP